MEDSQVVDLEEFRQLRSEIGTRMTVSNQLVSYTVTALAAGLVVFDKYPDALLGLTLVPTCFWLLWLDHAAQIFKIACYIAIRLAPRLQCGQQGTLGWEHFLRRLDDGKLAEITGTSIGRAHPTKAAFTYTEILLGGSAGALIIVYFGILLTAQTFPGYPRIVGIVFSAAFWGYAVYRAIRVAVMHRQIGTVIVASES